jgi:coproporphyrinogen III oxidase-like Fe-S oxidoreductase
MKKVRHANVKGISAYIQTIKEGKRPIAESYEVTYQEDMENFMMLGLRLLRGIDPNRFYSLYRVSLDEVYGPVLNRLFAQGLLTKNGERIALTDKGLIYGNEVFASFLQEH